MPDQMRFKNRDMARYTLTYSCVFIILLATAAPGFCQEGVPKIIDCLATSNQNTKIVADLNQQHAKTNVLYLMEGIFFGVEPAELEDFINKKAVDADSISDLIGTMNSLSEKMNTAQGTISTFKEDLAANEELDLQKASGILRSLAEDFGEKLIAGFEDAIKNLNQSIASFEQLGKCLVKTQEEIRKEIDDLKTKRQAIPPGSRVEYVKALESSIKQYEQSIVAIGNTIASNNSTFVPTQEYATVLLGGLDCMLGVAISFEAHLTRVLTVLQNIQTPPPSISTLKNLDALQFDLIAKMTADNSDVKDRGKEIRKILTEMEKDLEYKPSLFDSNKPTYNELFQSAFDMLISLDKLHKALDELLVESPTPESVVIMGTIRVTDAYGDTVTVTPGDYKIVDRSVDFVLIEDNDLNEYKIPANTFYQYAKDAPRQK